MSDQNTTTGSANTNPNTQGTNTTDQATEATPCKLWPTKAECEANKPADAPKSLRVYEVSKAGATVGFIWARGYDHGLACLAKLEGFSVSLGNKTAPVTKQGMTAALEAMTADERAALLAKYLPAPTPPTVPAPTPPTPVPPTPPVPTGRRRNSP